MKVYIEKKDGEWLNENSFAASVGFKSLGFDVEGFETDEIDRLSLSSSTIVHGNVKTVRKAFDLLNATQPEIHNPHEHLTEFFDRKFEELSYYQVKLSNEFPFFIKPLKDHKLFTGKVINSQNDFDTLDYVSDNALILKVEYINIKSEYRCFVLEGKLIGVKHYNGDFKLFPDFKLIESAISKYKQQPVAYSIDFGITDKGTTELIELNDAFSLGCYGLNPKLYASMIMKRWDQIVNEC